MTEAQEKRVLTKAFNELQSRRTRANLIMATYLWNVNGIECALTFLAKMKEYEQAEQVEAVE